MKTVSISELHNRTGELVREASRQGEIRVTDNGRVVAKILPQAKLAKIPYFARRKPSAAFKKLDESGKTGRGTDSTIVISQDREDRPDALFRLQLPCAPAYPGSRLGKSSGAGRH